MKLELVVAYVPAAVNLSTSFSTSASVVKQSHRIDNLTYQQLLNLNSAKFRGK